MEEAGILVCYPVAMIAISQTYVEYRPSEYVKKSTYLEDSEDEDSTMGKMPPSDSEGEE